MIFFKDKISQLKIGWNVKPLTEIKFHRLCKKLKIKAVEMPLQIDGFYYCVKGKHYIAVNSKLPERQKLFVMWHEFAHFLRHIPNTNETANFSRIGERDFKEDEADIFAYCAIIPLTWLKSKTVSELIEEECFSLEFVNERFEIYEKYKM